MPARRSKTPSRASLQTIHGPPSRRWRPDFVWRRWTLGIPHFDHHVSSCGLIVLGIILILVGYLLPVPAIIATIGWILLIIGIVLLILGQVGRPVGGRRYWY